MFFLNRNVVSDDKKVSPTKREYGSLVYLLFSFIKSLKSVSDKCVGAISWSSFLLGIFIIKECLEFSLIALGTFK